MKRPIRYTACVTETQLALVAEYADGTTSNVAGDPYNLSGARIDVKLHPETTLGDAMRVISGVRKDLTAKLIW